MGRLLPLMFLINIALVCIALIDCLSTDETEIRALPKIVWALIILLFSPVGPIVWFVAGRPQRAATGGGSAGAGSAGRGPAGIPWPAAGQGGEHRPLGPDDDPEFLRKLSSQARKADEERLRAWEDDLHRREEELRRQAEDDDPPEPKTR